MWSVFIPFVTFCSFFFVSSFSLNTEWLLFYLWIRLSWMRYALVTNFVSNGFFSVSLIYLVFFFWSMLMVFLFLMDWNIYKAFSTNYMAQCRVKTTTIFIIWILTAINLQSNKRKKKKTNKRKMNCPWSTKMSLKRCK